MSTTDERPEYCKVSSEECANSRRCFMTGEHCSKQMNVHQERKKQHTKQTRTPKKNSEEFEYKDSYEINAFVVMNFSDMSNVVYKWHLRSFIESLAKYLYINTKTHEVICVADRMMPFPMQELPKDMSMDDPQNPWKQVDQINVIRSDSNPGSNYVICNRVCQQMQIADLVIVDVSVENTNVFYELGMAMAFGKLILPICYNESIFEHVLPEKQEPDGKSVSKAIKRIRNYDMENAYHQLTGCGDGKSETVKMEKHIDCFPWRRKLFEYYGIRFKRADSAVQYGPFSGNQQGKQKRHGVKEGDFGFTDIHYNRFPYDQKIDPETAQEENKRRIGVRIYNRLRDSYNRATPMDNTLVVYTMDGFMNEGEAGRCIVNFYTYMTAQMKHLQCFQGDRVGILVQENIIKEDVKDAKAKKDLMYNIGNIIHIGMNQATYATQKERIKTKDYLSDKDPDASETTDDTQETEERKQQLMLVKNHVGNRSITILPDHPIYVEHVKDGIQMNVLPDAPENGKTVENQENVPGWNELIDRYYCLYHIMLRTLAYTHEIVVDISNNSLQALFWLGAAHGSDANAITVRYERTEKEEAEEFQKFGRQERPIFDVSGLWTAILRSHDTEGFYRELMQAQLSIEQHNKLVLEELDIYSEKILDYLHEASYRDRSSKEVQVLVDNKKDKEARKLESYYRDYFWRRMLLYNKLHMYLGEYPEQEGTDLVTPLEKRDVKTVAEFSHYLSKRKVIGEYYIETLNDKKVEEGKDSIGNQNFVCIGGNVKPFIGKSSKQNLPEYICGVSKLKEYPTAAESSLFVKKSSAADLKTAKLVFWREVPQSYQQNVKFQVALIGQNGAATRALSSVLVDREQKIAMFGVDWDQKRDIDKLFLNELQRKIRSTFSDRFITKYKAKRDSDYQQSLLTCVRLYLSTVLYRYFMPFLTREDEHRICNGMEAFLITLRHSQTGKEQAEKMPDFEKCVKEALAEVLGEFRGVNVEYTAEVGANGKIADIILNQNGVTCLFVEK